ncbi:MAG: UDP-3-O-(3-hydroxymyristoyl)glucosamine N-acyltransferase [Bergeyella sp.]|nr:UDP-3-O-(3-hydroxymyristoyl)glucosamine N-acyltransferase [Bergeyella sp.]
MEYSASQIAEYIGGEIIGNPNTLITGVSPIEEGEKGCLSFIDQDRFERFLEETKCSVVIVSKRFVKTGKSYNPTLIVVEDAYPSFQRLMHLYQASQERRTGIEQGAFIHENAQIEEGVYVGAFAYISEKTKVGTGTLIYPQVYIGKGVRIGKNCKVDSGVKIYDYCRIGDNCVIHSNSVIGGDGFGFQLTPEGFKKIPQLGNVIIEDEVEIGSNCSIDRATIGSTVIGKGSKIDNLIQIAHNVKIGKNNVIAAQTGIAGSSTLGDWNQIGGQVGIVGHIKIGNKVKIQAQSGVNNNLANGEIVYGSPAFAANDFRKNYVHFRNLTQIVKRVDRIEKNSLKAHE